MLQLAPKKFFNVDCNEVDNLPVFESKVNRSACVASGNPSKSEDGTKLVFII